MVKTEDVFINEKDTNSNWPETADQARAITLEASGKIPMALLLRLILPALLACSNSAPINQPLAIFVDGRRFAAPGRALRFNDGLIGPLRGGQQSLEQPTAGTGKPIQLNPQPGTDNQKAYQQ